MIQARRLRRLFAYDAWANRETLTSLRAMEAERAASAARLLAHVAATKHLWLARIRGEPAPMPVWPELDLQGVAAALADADARWHAYVALLGPAELSRVVPYVNSKAEAWNSSVDDILDHVLLHGHYHRGQIASLVRAAGGMPAYTDYIHAVRTHALPPEEIVNG
jgi:uncharacterized damage-inducible protein DinB